MEFFNNVHFIAGLKDTIYDWRYLALLFGVELFLIRHVLKRWKSFQLIVAALIAVQVVHGLLYFYRMVPAMHWFIPVTDPFVAQVVRYQWIALGVVTLLFIIGHFISRRHPLYNLDGRKKWTFTADLPPRHLMGPLLLIVLFVLAQQLFGYLSGYWLYQESDVVRSINYADIFIKNGFKAFTDIWMFPFNRYEQFELDLPLIPLVWGILYKFLHTFIATSALPDIVNHILALAFWILSIAGTYLLGREFFNRQVGALAALFLAFTPYYSYMGYFYMIDVPLTAFVTLSIYCFIRAVKENRSSYGVMAGLLFFLAVFTKYIGLYLVWIIPFIFFMYRKKGEWRQLLTFTIGALIGPVIIAIVLFSLYGEKVFQLVTEYIARKRFVVQLESTRARNGYVSLYHNGPTSFFFYLRYMTGYIGFGVITLAIAALALRWKEHRCALRERLLLAFWFFALLIYFSIPLTKASRWLFSAYPALMILAAYGFVVVKESLMNNKLAYFLLSIILVEMVGRHISYYYCLVAKEWIVGYHYAL